AQLALLAQLVRAEHGREGAAAVGLGETEQLPLALGKGAAHRRDADNGRDLLLEQPNEVHVGHRATDDVGAVLVFDDQRQGLGGSNELHGRPPCRDRGTEAAFDAALTTVYVLTNS